LPEVLTPKEEVEQGEDVGVVVVEPEGEVVEVGPLMEVLKTEQKKEEVVVEDVEVEEEDVIEGAEAVEEVVDEEAVEVSNDQSTTESEPEPHRRGTLRWPDASLLPKKIG
jgi:ribosomal protein L24